VLQCACKVYPSASLELRFSSRTIVRLCLDLSLCAKMRVSDWGSMETWAKVSRFHALRADGNNKLHPHQDHILASD